MEKDQNIEDKQKGNVESLPQDTPATPLNTPEFKSIGLRVHNELTYRGVDFLLNSALAVAFAVWSKRTAVGQKYFSEPVANGFKSLIKPFSKNPTTINEGATWGARFLSIMIGGTAIIPFMTALENKSVKKSIVRSVDEMAYGKAAVENDAKFAELYESIDHEPKKDFWTGMIARFAVLTPMILATITPAINNIGKKYMYEPVANGSKFVAAKMGIKPKGMMNKVMDGQSNWDFTHETIGFDLSLTFIYSLLHEKIFKGLAGRKHDKTQEIEHTPEIVTHTPETPEDTSHPPHNNNEHNTPRIAKKSDSFVTNLNTQTTNAQMAV